MNIPISACISRYLYACRYLCVFTIFIRVNYAHTRQAELAGGPVQPGPAD